MTEVSTTTQMTEMTRKPEMNGMLSTLRAIPGLRRAWPEHRSSGSTSMSIECVDGEGRLRAGHVTAGATPDLLPYATDPALPALSAPYRMGRTYRYGKIAVTIYHRDGDEGAQV